MKKITLAFIALLIGILLLGLYGCGKKPAERVSEAGVVGLASPMTELRREDPDKSGFGFIVNDV